MKIESTGYAAPSPFVDASDCSIRALAVACGLRYATASAVFASQGRAHGRGTDLLTTELVHERLLAMRRVRAVESWRLAHVAQMLSKGRYVLHKRKHAFALVDGVIHDWAGGTGPGTIVLRIWHVTEETEERAKKLEAIFGLASV